MLEHTKKYRTNKLIRLNIIGPAVNRDKLIRNLKEFGYSDTSESVPWREAFPEYDETKEAVSCLAGARYKEGLTQRDLSEKIGIPQKYISEMENGKRLIGRTLAATLSETLRN